MKNNTALHSLIHSMTSSEKRHFSISIDRYNKKNSVLSFLYKIILEQDVYDEKSIVDKFKDQSFVNQLGATKSKLYKTILYSIKNAYASNTISLRLREMLQLADILLNKSFPNKCIELTKKVKKIAYQYEKFNLVLEAIDMQMLVYQNWNDIKSKSLIVELLSEKGLVNKKTKNIIAFQKLHNSLLLAFDEIGDLAFSKKLKETTVFTEHELLQAEKNAISLTALELFYSLKSSLNYFLRDTQKAYRFTKKRAALCHDNKLFNEDFSSKTLLAISNHISICSILNKTQELNYWRDVIKSYYKTSSKSPLLNASAVSIARYFYSVELPILYKEGDSKNINVLLSTVKKYNDAIVRSMQTIEIKIYWYNLGIMHFYLGNFEQAADYIYKTLNNTSKKLRKDIHAFSKIYQLFIHFELENFRLLENLVSQYYRDFQTNKYPNSNEVTVINFYKKNLKNLHHRKLINQQLKVLFAKMNYSDEKERSNWEILSAIYC